MVDTCVDLTKCGKTNDEASTICDFHFVNILYAFLKNHVYHVLCIAKGYNLSAMYWRTCWAQVGLWKNIFERSVCKGVCDMRYRRGLSQICQETDILLGS